MEHDIYLLLTNVLGISSENNEMLKKLMDQLDKEKKQVKGG